MDIDKPDMNGLAYDPDTGLFVWIDHHFKALIGKRAGRLNSNGYRQIAFKMKRFYEHRLAWLYMTGEWPKDQIDHINHVRDDNRWCNLREASRLENTFNILSNKNNKLGLKGVHLHVKGKYVAQIRINGKMTVLGRFDTPEEAKLAYDMKSKELHKEFYYNPD